ncbi:MAG TPA: UbiA family prenyltransferase [Ktedonobacteraceae bacterium]|jgi:4-hydroxybenzoate polyprenyltransferase|nr:UbiA family prenyltransferase [Ktedonobacteraceae bacterium]
MEFARKRRPTEILRGFFLLCHPGPVLLHTVAIFMLALLAAWPHLVPGIIALLVAAHLAMQLSIAILNDYCDRRQDAASKKRKPIPLGMVRPREALIAGLLLIPVMILLLLPLNPLALLISLLYLAFGQGYNLGLKATPFSGIVFALAIPLIPVYAFAGVGHVISLVFWLVPVAALLGVALNLANSLPDLEEDAASSVRTLAVALGLKRSLIVCPLLIFLSMVLIGTLTVTLLVPARIWIVAPALLVGCLALIAMLLYFGPERPLRARKLYFYLVAATCLVLAAGWLTGALL